MPYCVCKATLMANICWSCSCYSLPLGLTGPGKAALCLLSVVVLFLSSGCYVGLLSSIWLLSLLLSSGCCAALSPPLIVVLPFYPPSDCCVALIFTLSFNSALMQPFCVSRDRKSPVVPSVCSLRCTDSHPIFFRKETAQYWLDILSISISHLHANNQLYGEALNDLISGAPLLASSVFFGATANKNKLFLHTCMCVCVCVFVCVCVCVCVCMCVCVYVQSRNFKRTSHPRNRIP